MDQTLHERLKVFRSMPTVPDRAVDLVADELARLDPEQQLSDDEAGAFVSHAVNALARLVAGDDSVEAPAEAVYQQVAAQDPSAADQARAFAARVADRIGHTLPDPELKFMTIHFAALRQHLTKEHP